MVIKILPNDKGAPNGKLADAEVHFTEGALDGLRLLGFAVWERRSGVGRNVTFPARTYSVNGERRSFALLRPINGEPTRRTPCGIWCSRRTRNSNRKQRSRADSRAGGACCRAGNRVDLRSDFVRSSRFEDRRRQALDEASTGETLADLRQLPVVEDGVDADGPLPTGGAMAPSISSASIQSHRNKVADW